MGDKPLSRRSDVVDWEARYRRLEAGALETRECVANYAEMRLTDVQRATLINVVEPINEALMEAH